MEDHIRMCRFIWDDEPTMGEYEEQLDGTGICHTDELHGLESMEVVVSYPDGTMPPGISDLELFNVPISIGTSTDGTNHIPPELEESFGKTRLILDEYEMGVLDEKEASKALYDHLFGEGRKKLNAQLRAKGYSL